MEIAKRFRLTLTGNWISKVHDKVEEVLLKEFKINRKTAHRIKNETELNPFIIRFFRQVHSVQISHLCHKQFIAMSKYLEFLVKFIT